ncbi:MAG TPA: hypothetical protein VK970_10835 [Candidatus Methylacidiphilales bacterium]|nr:hypothetical protein [Candidatus Methylacidiphilales bacterium]
MERTEPRRRVRSEAARADSCRGHCESLGRYATSGQFAGNIAKYPATAIFKCSNQPPAGETQFLTLDGLPTDHYLRGAGEFGKALKKAVEAH